MRKIIRRSDVEMFHALMIGLLASQLEGKPGASMWVCAAFWMVLAMVNSFKEKKDNQ